MAEVSGRFVVDEASRSPAANTWKLIYTATASGPLGLDVCNGMASDAHVDVYILPAAAAYVDGAVPAAYGAVHSKQRIESDGTDGSTWVMPVKMVNTGDFVVVRTDLVGVTFYPHGYRGL
jgi:hypothetical protein